ncbi:hypothetical protein Salat_1824000 [Sesamum alatum]|uniref:Nucleotide-diphospho-sugar transferase domain-containing protein n=1 Tax=Sesamum alatum TaxID=300844 RepID=A0AAE2CHL9_9LAMI|nr:hypothetical protein Salat_1824000 [Sesamum alatum]
MDYRGGGSNPKGHREPGGNHQRRHHHFPSVVVKITILVAVVGLTRLALHQSGCHTQRVSKQQRNPSPPSATAMLPDVPSSLHKLRSKDVYGIDDENKLKKTLKRAVMKDHKTVIITTVNAAWTEPNSIFDLFMESFRIGNQTQSLLKHLVVVALDQKAYSRCLNAHPHCFALTTAGVDFSGQAFFMTGDYLKMMWRRIDFLRSVLEMGYNFIFSDADIMWLRDPFSRFYPDGDFQIACDTYKNDPTDLRNLPNGGFTYVKSNNRTIQFYKFWYNGKDYFPGIHDQDVFNKIKFNPFIVEIRLGIRFLDTAYFGGFCQPSKDLDLVVTMHANCCLGLENKIHDIKMVIEDWKRYLGLMAVTGQKNLSNGSWTAPWRCGMKTSKN